MSNKRLTYYILVLGALTTVSPFAIDLYLPGFPAIAKDLATSISNVQLSLTAYLIGISVGQLLYGPLLDRFGRKPPLYAGLFLYLVASLGCAMSGSVENLIAMRFIQAIGGCAGMVAAQTLVRDIFPPERTAHVFSWITLVVAVSPMIAPTAGGYLTIAFGWESVFVVLAVIAFLLIAMVYFILPAGRLADASISLRPRAVLANFADVIRDRQFRIYCIAGGFASSAPFAFIAGSSDVFINFYGMTEQQFGWGFALVGGVIIGCTQLNHLLLRKYKSEQVIFAGFTFQLIVGALLILCYQLGWLNAPLLLAMIIVFLAPHGLSNSNTTALSLAPFTRTTGSAASLLGTFRMTIGAGMSALVALFHNGTPLPMIATMVFSVVTGFVVLAVARRRTRLALQAEQN